MKIIRISLDGITNRKGYELQIELEPEFHSFCNTLRKFHRFQKIVQLSVYKFGQLIQFKEEKVCRIIVSEEIVASKIEGCYFNQHLVPEFVPQFLELTQKEIEYCIMNAPLSEILELIEARELLETIGIIPKMTYSETLQDNMYV